MDLEARLPQGALQVQAEFDELVVWGHEAAVDGSADPYLRAAAEWIALAEQVGQRCFPASRFAHCFLTLVRSDQLVPRTSCQGQVS